MKSSFIILIFTNRAFLIGISDQQPGAIDLLILTGIYRNRRLIANRILELLIGLQNFQSESFLSMHIMKA